MLLVVFKSVQNICIQSFNNLIKYLSGTYYVLGTNPGTEDITVKKLDKNPCLSKLYTTCICNCSFMVILPECSSI